MRVVFALFLAVLLFNGQVSAGKAERRRRRRQAELVDEVVRQLTCCASRVVLNIHTNTCPNIRGWAPHSDIILFDKYISVCDHNCVVRIIKTKKAPNMVDLQFYSLTLFSVAIWMGLVLSKNK